MIFTITIAIVIITNIFTNLSIDSDMCKDNPLVTQ